MKRPDELFDRVVSILEQARGNVVRAVNTNMALAYWLIGREIVEEIQRGKGRATYGEQVVENLSAQLTARYGSGFSVANLKNFRQLYQVYPDRCGSISYPTGIESANTLIPRPLDGELTRTQKSYPLGSLVGRVEQRETRQIPLGCAALNPTYELEDSWDSSNISLRRF